MLILTEDFEERAQNYITTGLLLETTEQRSVKEDEWAIQQCWSLLVMHWLGHATLRGLPADLLQAEYEERSMPISHFEAIEHPYGTQVPVIWWKGGLHPVTDIKRIISATPWQGEGGLSYTLTRLGTFEQNTNGDEVKNILEGFARREMRN